MITSLVQDKDGFVWAGTMDGLNRFDGYGFKTYRFDPSKNSISGNQINSLLEDTRGLLWIGIDHGGLNCYDKKKGRFIDLSSKMPPHFKDGIGIVKIFEVDPWRFLLIAAADVYELTLPKGFPDDVASADKARIEPLPQLHNPTIGLDFIHRVVRISPTTLGIVAHGQLKYFDLKAKVFTGPAQDYCIDKNNPEEVLWADTAFGCLWTLKNKFFYCIRAGKIVSATALTFEGLPSPDERCSGIYRDGAHRFYFRFAQGFATIQEKDLGKSNPVYRPLLQKGKITKIDFGKSNRVWIGTNGYGIFTFVNGNELFRRIGNTSVYRIYKTEGKGLLVEGYEGTAARNGATGYLGEVNEQKLTIETGPAYLDDLLMVKQTSDQRNCFFYRHGSIGLSFSDPYRTDKRYDVEARLNFLEVQAHIDRKNNIWASTDIAKLVCLWRGADTLATYDLSPMLGGNALNGLIKQIGEDRDGSLWLSTEAGLLHLYVGERKILGHRLFRNQRSDAASLASDLVLSVLEDPAEPAKYLWVCTRGGGVDKLEKQTGVCVHHTMRDGLPNNVVYGAINDDYGRIWFSTNNGLSCFIPGKRYFRNFSTEDGLQDNEFNTASFFKDGNGRLFFGGVGGLIVFDPAQIWFDTGFAPVFFTSLKINNRSIDAEGTGPFLGEPMEFTEEVRLSHNQNFIGIAFVATDFRQLGKNIFRYKMEGVDKDWIYGDQRNEVSYPDLSPGTYVFRVCNANGNGDWNPISKSIRFIVLPPWWRSTAAYFVYTVSILASLWLLFRFQLQKTKLRDELRLKAATLAMQEKESMRLAELDAYKNRFFTNIAHELRTPLTLILEPARLLMTDERLSGSSVVGTIYNNALRLLRLVNTLLDISKIEAGKMQLHFAWGEVAPLVRSVFDSFELAARQKGLELLFSASPEAVNARIDRQMVEKIAHNLLSNAIKFTPSGGTVELRIGTDGPDHWTLMVIDNGIGIPENQSDRIFERFYQIDNGPTRRGEGTGIGLALVKELLDLVNGNVQVESRDGKGTRFTVTFPINPQVAGSKAITGRESENADGSIVPTFGSREVSPYVQPDVWTMQELAVVTDSHGQPPTALVAGKATPSVLLVEDNAELRAFVGGMLRQKGFDVSEAEDGDQGIEKARSMMPDLIISDLMMPKTDGFELVGQLKNDVLTCHVPIILLTARHNFASKLEGYRAGADAYIGKPFHSDELLTRINQLLAASRRLRDYFSRPRSVDVAAVDQGLTVVPPQKQVSEEKKDLGLSPLDEGLLEKINAFVNENIDSDKFTVDDIADHLAMGRSQFYRKLSALTGQSPVVYVRNLKLDLAYRLMRSGECGTVASAMAAVGMTDRKHFGAKFKERFSVTPAQVLKNQEK